MVANGTDQDAEVAWFALVVVVVDQDYLEPLAASVRDHVSAKGLDARNARGQK